MCNLLAELLINPAPLSVSDRLAACFQNPHFSPMYNSIGYVCLPALRQTLCALPTPEVVWRSSLTEKPLTGVNQPGSITLEVLRG